MTRSEARRLAAALASAALIAGCGSNEPTTPFAPTDPAGPLFAPDHIVEVAIEVDPADWDVLRRQTRTWYDVVVAQNRQCMAQPFVKPYTWVPGSVTVDGVRRDHVMVRKKGYLGSLNETRPALKLRFDPDQRLYGLSRLTLNNATQDPTWLRQCLSYQVFAKGGVPVPWCNFAHLTVNGKDLGLYVNLESIDRHWVRRNFERDEGELWEGELSDFRLGWTDTFEKEGNVDDQKKVDRSSLEAVANVVSEGWSGPGLHDQLEKLIDVDEFLRFWATERILDHWDGYAEAANNFYIYRDPADDRFVFMPSGTDQITLLDPWGDPNTPASVYARGILANRLYHGPERELYVETLKRLLDSAFHEDELLAEIDRMQALVTPVLARAGVDLAAQARAVAELRTWIAGRRAELLADVSDGPHNWRQDLKANPCMEFVATVEGSFATTFDPVSDPYSDVDTFRTGSGTMAANYRDHAITFSRVGAFAGYDPHDAYRWPYVHMIGESPDGVYDVRIYVDPKLFKPGTAGPFEYDWAGGQMFTSYSPSQSIYLGNLFSGRLELDAAGLQPGARVSGRFRATVAKW